MTIEDLFEWRRKMPELTRDALVLLAFISYRMNITSMSDDKGKYIYLTGQNDPVRCLGFSRSQYEKAKAQLKASHLIDVKKQGVCSPAKTYLTLESYSPYHRIRGIENGGIENGGNNICKSVVITSANRWNALHNKVNSKENRKENRDIPDSFFEITDEDEVQPESKTENDSFYDNIIDLFAEGEDE